MFNKSSSNICFYVKPSYLAIAYQEDVMVFHTGTTNPFTKNTVDFLHDSSNRKSQLALDLEGISRNILSSDGWSVQFWERGVWRGTRGVRRPSWCHSQGPSTVWTRQTGCLQLQCLVLTRTDYLSIRSYRSMKSFPLTNWHPRPLPTFCDPRLPLCSPDVV